MFGDILVVTTGRLRYWHLVVEVRDAAKHLTTHRKPFPHRTTNDLAQKCQSSWDREILTYWENKKCFLKVNKFWLLVEKKNARSNIHIFGVPEGKNENRSEKNQRRRWHPTPVLLPGKSHGWRSLVGSSPWGRQESDTTERLYFHFSPSCIRERNGNPLQCSCLENPRDRGAWWAAIYGVAQSWTRLK